MARAEGCLARTRVRCLSIFFFTYFSCAKAVLSENVALFSHSFCTSSSPATPCFFRRAMSSWLRPCAEASLRSKISLFERWSSSGFAACHSPMGSRSAGYKIPSWFTS